jgi:hypothetical protein
MTHKNHTIESIAEILILHLYKKVPETHAEFWALSSTIASLAVFREHWLTFFEHDKTDVDARGVACGCGWRSDLCANESMALREWIKHANACED